jgi:hypothetical protein
VVATSCWFESGQGHHVIVFIAASSFIRANTGNETRSLFWLHARLAFQFAASRSALASEHLRTTDSAETAAKNFSPTIQPTENYKENNNLYRPIGDDAWTLQLMNGDGM